MLSALCKSSLTGEHSICLLQLRPKPIAKPSGGWWPEVISSFAFWGFFVLLTWGSGSNHPGNPSPKAFVIWLCWITKQTWQSLLHQRLTDKSSGSAELVLLCLFSAQPQLPCTSLELRPLYSQCICVAFPLYVSSCGPPAYIGLWKVSALGNSPAIGTQTLSSHRVCGHCWCAVQVEQRLHLNRNTTSAAALL